MRNHLLSVSAMIAVLAVCSPPGMAQDKPTPRPSLAAPQSADADHALDPASGFDSLYSIGNLAKHQHAHIDIGKEILAAQNARKQPPVSPPAYAAYIHNDPLVSMFQQLNADPNLDPNLLGVMAWNHVALDMTSIDHTTAGKRAAPPGNTAPFDVFEASYGEQFGPPRSSRALAIVHLAMFEAANTIDHRFNSYVLPGTTTNIQNTIVADLGGIAPDITKASTAAAVSQAAHDTLAALYPAKKSLIDNAGLQISVLVSAYEDGTNAADAPSRLSLGTRIGADAAAQVLAARNNDKSDVVAMPKNCLPAPDGATLPPKLCWESFFPAGVPVPAPANPLTWTIDPVSQNPLQLGVNWGNVTPFVLKSHEFVTPAGLLLPSGPVPVPTATDPKFLDSLNKGAYGPMIPDPHGGAQPIASRYGVKIYGSKDGNTAKPGDAPNGRTEEQTQFAQIWGYDATALLCAPPRLYNQIATAFYMEQLKPASDPHAAVAATRYLALVNLAMAEAGIAAWDAKWTYRIARPVSYIRSNTSPAPSDNSWTPLGQVGSNGLADNTTPAFPAYPSGHAVFGGALFEMMSKALSVNKETGGGLDFVSDEYDGQTFGADGKVRPLIPLHYVSLRAAEWENAESRIFLGIHWQRDADDGTALGNEIADAVYSRVLQPLTLN